MSRTRLIGVGAFLIAGALLFAGGLFLIGDRRLLFTTNFELNTTLGKVTGLQVGSRVRLSGLEAGEIVDIAIPARPSERFRVRMRVRDDVRQLIRTDSICAVQTDGIVGSTFIQIGGGTDDSAIVEPGGTIGGRDPVEFADLIQAGQETFRIVNREFIDLKETAAESMEALRDTVQSTTELIGNVDTGFAAVAQGGAEAMNEVRRIADGAGDIVDGVRAGRGTIGQLLTDDSLYQRIKGIGEESERTLANLREMTDRGRTMMAAFTARDGAGQQIVQTLAATTAQAEEVLSDLAEGTEALKRNFLFRGFFRSRGFYDLDALSVDAYAAGALEGKDRTALRVWVDAGVLFARDADGVEQLTEAGRRRLDAIMADFVRYPRESPLVVEGYASSAGDVAYIVSAERGAIVRDYVRSRFRRKSTLLDFMPMGERAVGSPSGDGRWSGVALTLFVNNRALER